MCFYGSQKNSEFCPTQLTVIGFYNREGKCLLRGTNWGFIKKTFRLVLKGLSISLYCPGNCYYINWSVSATLWIWKQKFWKASSLKIKLIDENIKAGHHTARVVKSSWRCQHSCFTGVVCFIYCLKHGLHDFLFQLACVYKSPCNKYVTWWPSATTHSCWRFPRSA